MVTCMSVLIGNICLDIRCPLGNRLSNHNNVQLSSAEIIYILVLYLSRFDNALIFCLHRRRCISWIDLSSVRYVM